MLPYTHLFFDLDGTLTDPALGITNGILCALRRYGIEVEDRRSLYPFIGPPLRNSFQRFFGFEETQAREAVGLYRSYYGETGLFENEPYPGMDALLARLRGAGYCLAVATGKPEPFAVRILQRFGLAEHFALIAGSTLDDTRTQKAEVIRYAMERLGLSDPTRVLMIGDREHDVLGARACGMACLGVLYGYGSRAELEQAGAVQIAEDVEGLGRLLLE